MLDLFQPISQALSIILVGLVAGTMFGIWRGYNVAGYSPAVFLQVHQGAVRGLNTLLPAMALAALVLIVILAFVGQTDPTAVWAYLAAAVLLALGGAITRFANQPINDQVMLWTADTMPSNWSALRDTWWSWHLIRLAITLLAEIVLIWAVFADG